MLRALPLALLLAAVPACDLAALLNADECSSDSDCSGDDICDGGECVECEDDRDCDDDEECNDGECEPVDAGEGEGEGEGDAGEGEGEGEGEAGCGALTIFGECAGNTLRFCDVDDTVVEIPCETATCTLINDDFGFDCAQPPGDACVFQDPNNPDGVIFASCQGSQAGCEIPTTGGSQCVNGAGVCSDADVDTCDGSRFIVVCVAAAGGNAGQAGFIDCANFSGGSCLAQEGCLVSVAGAACLPGISQCGADAATAVACPESRICP